MAAESTEKRKINFIESDLINELSLAFIGEQQGINASALRETKWAARSTLLQPPSSVMNPSAVPRPDSSAIALLWLCLALGLTSCGTFQFKRDFKAAAKAPPQESALGAWSGTWTSSANGHHGKLQCLVTAPVMPNEPYQFRYRATWMKVLSGTFSAQHTVFPQGPSQSTFSGQHQMPSWAGGLYSYEGKINGNAFHAKYDSVMDQGDYRMTRVSANSAAVAPSHSAQSQ
jgi:hypothetical protein